MRIRITSYNVCYTKLLRKNAGSHTHEGTEYLFCSTKCLEKFAADPEAYLQPQPDAAEPFEAARKYTCPMHPEIVQQGPGSCPICGMALEPLTVSAVRTSYSIHETKLYVPRLE